jgi:hypothetical protein
LIRNGCGKKEKIFKDFDNQMEAMGKVFLLEI